MNKQSTEKRNTNRLLTGLFSQATPPKTSGLAYSLATVLPVVFAFLFLIAITLFGLVQEGVEEQDWYLYSSFLLPQLAFACVAVLLLGYTGGSIKESVKKQACAPKYMAIALLMQIGLFSLSALNELFLGFLQNHGYGGAEVRIPSLDGAGFFGVMLVVALLPAVFEEILFRGFILNGLKSAFSETGAILLCGALFALYHQNPAQTLYQFCCGTAFAFVAIRAKSVLPTMLAHLFNNAFIITIEKYPVTWIYSSAFTAVSAVCLVSALVWLMLCKRDAEETVEKTGKKTFFVYASVGIIVCVIAWISVLVQGG